MLGEEEYEDPDFVHVGHITGERELPRDPRYLYVDQIKDFEIEKTRKNVFRKTVKLGDSEDGNSVGRWVSGVKFNGAERVQSNSERQGKAVEAGVLNFATETRFRVESDGANDRRDETRFGDKRVIEPSRNKSSKYMGVWRSSSTELPVRFSTQASVNIDPPLDMSIETEDAKNPVVVQIKPPIRVFSTSRLEVSTTSRPTTTTTSTSTTASPVLQEFRQSFGFSNATEFQAIAPFGTESISKFLATSSTDKPIFDNKKLKATFTPEKTSNYSLLGSSFPSNNTGKPKKPAIFWSVDKINLKPVFKPPANVSTQVFAEFSLNSGDNSAGSIFPFTTSSSTTTTPTPTTSSPSTTRKLKFSQRIELRPTNESPSKMSVWITSGEETPKLGDEVVQIIDDENNADKRRKKAGHKKFKSNRYLPVPRPPPPPKAPLGVPFRFPRLRPEASFAEERIRNDILRKNNLRAASENRDLHYRRSLPRFKAVAEDVFRIRPNQRRDYRWPLAEQHRDNELTSPILQPMQPRLPKRKYLMDEILRKSGQTAAARRHRLFETSRMIDTDGEENELRSKTSLFMNRSPLYTLANAQVRSEKGKKDSYENRKVIFSRQLYDNADATANKQTFYDLGDFF